MRWRCANRAQSGFPGAKRRYLYGAVGGMRPTFDPLRSCVQRMGIPPLYRSVT
jgi:hypothetical protein